MLTFVKVGYRSGLIQVKTYLIFSIFFKNNINTTTYNLSLYYQVINLLNTKNNILVITIITIIVVATYYKNINYFLLVWILLLFYLNLLSVGVYKGLFQTLSSNIITTNTNLLNGLMLIHPIILYCFYVIFLTKIFLVLYLKTSTTTQPRKHSFFWGGGLIYSSYSALILGCCWAEQELSWGGWWSWDFVELIALNFFLLMVFAIHTTTHNNNYKEDFRIGRFERTYLFVGLISAISAVRFNLINSIHNFIGVESQNQYYYYLLLLLGLVLFLLLYIYNPLIKTPFLLKSKMTLPTGSVNKTTLNLIYSSLKSKAVLVRPQQYIKIIIFLFYLLFLYNVYLINIINLNYNTQINTKYMFVNILNLALVWYFIKNHQTNNNKLQPTTISSFLLKLVTTVVLIVFKLNCLIFLLILANIFNLLNLNLRLGRGIYGFISKTTHTILLIFFISTLYQLYVFDIPYLNIVETWINLFKVSGCYLVIELHYLDFLNISNINYLNYELGVNTQNNNNAVEVFKTIFEKKLLLTKNTLLELYSYNTQLLIQPQSLVIYFTLILVQLILFNLSFRGVLVYI